MISLLDSNKSVVPVILNLHKNDISNHLADIFNIWLYTGLFPTILKVAKVLPVQKKFPNLTFPTINQFHYYPIWKKTLEKLMHNRVYNFFTKNNLIYLLKFGFRQQYSTFHASINLTELFGKYVGKGNIHCGDFVDW